MTEDNFHLNNFHPFPENKICSLETVEEHKREIDDRYYDKVDKYCEKHDISPKDYFERELDNEKTPSPEKFSYASMWAKAYDVEYETPEYMATIFKEKSAFDRAADWYYEGLRDAATEQEKEVLRIKYLNAIETARREQEEKEAQKNFDRAFSREEQGGGGIWALLFGAREEEREPRFASEKDRYEYMEIASEKYIENRADAIAEKLREKDESRGIIRGPEYDYREIGRSMAVDKFYGIEPDRDRAEAQAERSRENILHHNLESLREQEKYREEHGEDTKDYPFQVASSKDVERELEIKCTQAREIYYQREVDRFCEEHCISRDEYNLLIKNAERDGRLSFYPAEEWNTDRSYEERTQITAERCEREREEWNREFEEKFGRSMPTFNNREPDFGEKNEQDNREEKEMDAPLHGDSRFG